MLDWIKQKIDMLVHVHSHTLRDRPFKFKGSMWEGGRLFLSGKRANGTREPELRIEWSRDPVYLYSSCLRLDGGEMEVMLSTSIWPLGSVYLTFVGVVPQSWLEWAAIDKGRRDHTYSRELSCDVARDGRVGLSFFADPHSWCREDSWWRRFSFNPVDRLLGFVERESVDTFSFRVRVPMPERNYWAEVTASDMRIGRPRWPFTKSEIWCTAVFDPPIPVPSKHCGQGSVSETTVVASSIAEAVGQLVGTCLSWRDKYSSVEWEPEDLSPMAELLMQVDGCPKKDSEVPS